MNSRFSARLIIGVSFLVCAARIHSQPTISSLAPEWGPVGTAVRVEGAGFSSVPSENVVFFGPVKAQVSGATSDWIDILVPVGATFSKVTVVVGGLTAVSSARFRPTFSGSEDIGSSSFAPRVNFATGGRPPFNLAVDLDGDGKPDILVVNQQSGTISIFRNISLPGSPVSEFFAPRLDISTGSLPYSAAVADVDGDGQLDVVVTGGSTLSVFRNISTPGNILFAPRIDLPVGPDARSVVVGDLDGDGRLDLAVANMLSNDVAVFRNTSERGAISFLPAVRFPTGVRPYSMATEDIDGDGRLDIIVANSGAASISILRNLAVPGQITGSSFAPKVDFATPGTPLRLSVADLDGDAKPDIAVANYSGSVSIFRNASVPGPISTASLATRLDLAVPGNGKMAVIADVNGDGKPDLIVSSESSNTISIFRNIGSPGSITAGSFAPRIELISAINPTLISVVDLDGDGRPELVVDNYYSDTLSVFRNQIVAPQLIEFFANSQRLSLPQHTFIDSVAISMETHYPNGAIFYTLDGSAPSFASQRYEAPVVLRRSAVLRAIAYSADFLSFGEGEVKITVLSLYSLSATTRGGGTVTVNGPSGPYPSGSIVSVSATLAPGWTFLGWLGDAEGVSTTIEVAMTRHKAVEAVFGTALNTTVAGPGAVMMDPEAALYPYGSTVMLLAIPQPGNYFGAWGNAATGNSNPLTLSMTNSNPTVSSIFAPLGQGEFSLQVFPEGLGSIAVEPRANRYSQGQMVTLFAVGDEGQSFIEWTGDASGQQNPLTVRIDENTTIIARFTSIPWLAVENSNVAEEGFRLSVHGELGARYSLQRSAELADWTAFGLFTNSLGRVYVLDAEATNVPRQYYRAVRIAP